LGPITLKGNFVGYTENLKAYRILDLSSNVIIESRDVKFIENKFQIDSNLISEWVDNYEIEIESTNNTDFDPSSKNKRIKMDYPVELKRSLCTRKEKTLHPYYISSQSIVFLVEVNMTNVLNKISILLVVED